jgi:maltose alpha-D-glucosyltransferase/alpha-amylase
MSKTFKHPTALPKDPLWYRTAVIYELHVRAYHDSNADGIGDFPGLTQKLDYLRDLGVTALWLLPFYPSPLKDDGYDIADYYRINPIYGTLSDFKLFLRAAHERGLRVITELVINHTSDQHPWFLRSRRAKPGSVWRDFYVWSDTPDKYREARVIFKDFEPSNWSWDPVAQAYYWHRFYAHQPDLNFDHPAVRKEITRVLDFWLEMGVDGLRLDAVPYLYEREGTSCENLPETHAFLKTLRQHVDQQYGDRMLLAEANQWPEDAVAYLGAGKGDECHMAFHFPLMPRLFMALRMEDRVPIVDILEQTPPIPETSQWALFLRNHDELTLEMVTDEERDYMYRVYAHDRRARINMGIRRRLAPLLGNGRRRIELLNLLLLSLPGTPVIYYGDEIGMGDNMFLGDRNGVRTPMQWSSDKNAGFSRASPQALYLPIILDPEYHYEAVNVETQLSNSHSLLWWMRRVLALRKRWRALGQGTLRFLQPENRKILAFLREHEQERILVVANLSRFAQPVSLDLGPFVGTVPVELFGRTEFPLITDKAYPLTLSPHSVFWLSLETGVEHAAVASAWRSGEALTVNKEWEEVLTNAQRAQLEPCLASYVRERRWFGSKSREIKTLQVRDTLPVPVNGKPAFIILLQVEYVQGDPEEYQLPLAFATGPEAEALERNVPALAIARLRMTDTQTEGLLFDATGSRDFARALFDAVARRRRFKGQDGELEASSTHELRLARGPNATPLEPSLGKTDQSNTALVFQDKFMLKLFRRLDVGINPDLEIGRYLTERRFPHTPPVTLGIMVRYVPAAKDAWEHTLDTLNRYFDRVRTLPPESKIDPSAGGSILELAQQEIPPQSRAVVGTYLESAHLLGQRTAELHVALASETENKEFVPEPFTPFYQRALYQSMRNLTVGTLRLVRGRLASLGAPVRELAEKVSNLEGDILKRLRAVFEKPVSARRIRCHGDFHLGQVLYTGKDFILIDFEGESARPLSERRIKRSPLSDVAGMIRSFDYVAYAALLRQTELDGIPAEQVAQMEPWTRLWSRWISATYLRAYLEAVRPADLLPPSNSALAGLLDAYLLEKAVYEAAYELKHRPDWIKIPLQGILSLLEPGKPS